MNDDRLDKILQSASVPEPPPEYWEQFPAQVTRELRRSAHNPVRLPGSADRPVRVPARRAPFYLRPAFGFTIGIVLVCLLIGFRIGRQRPPSGSPASRGDATFAEAQKSYREIAELFPNQVHQIVFDKTGTHLVLADRADVPASSPVFMRICGPSGCQGIVTFSGQQIHLNGKPMDVLVGPMDEIILAGPDSLWSSKQAGNQIGAYRIQAEALHAQL